MTKAKANGKDLGPRPIDEDAMKAIPRKAAGLTEMALMAGGWKGRRQLSREVLGSDEAGPFKYMSKLLSQMTRDGLLVKDVDLRDHRLARWRWASFEEVTPTPERPEIPEWLLLPDRPSKLSDPKAPPGAQFHNSCAWQREREGNYYVQQAGHGFDMQTLTKADFVCWLTDIKEYTKGFRPPPIRPTKWFGVLTVSEVLLMLLQSGPEWAPKERDTVSDIIRVENAGAPSFMWLPETVLFDGKFVSWRPGHAFRLRTGAQDIRNIIRGGRYTPEPEYVAMLQREITAQFSGSQSAQQAPQPFDWRSRIA